MKKILIVDDEPAILTLLQYNLEAEHYQVETATDGQEALDKVRSEPFDFIILDLMLPSLSGLDVTRKIREEKIQTPIMILTAKDNETDKIVGLAGNANQITVGQITIDPENYKASKAGHRLQLTPKEFELLVYFAQRVGKTLSRDALLNGVWGFDYPAETRMVDIQVSHLRDKIETDPKHPDYLKTVRGFGYQMEAPHE